MWHYESLYPLAEELLASLQKKGWRLAASESCTGGLLGGILTEISGASKVFECSFVTYGNHAKQVILGIDEKILSHHGAVSQEVAIEMAASALQRADVQIAVSITGIAETALSYSSKPAGLVYFGFAIRSDSCSAVQLMHQKCQFGNIGRQQVRYKSIAFAFDKLLSYLK